MFMEMSRELHVFWDDYWKNTTLICFLAQDQKKPSTLSRTGHEKAIKSQEDKCLRLSQGTQLPFNICDTTIKKILNCIEMYWTPCLYTLLFLKCSV